ncbi:sideroflexin-1-like [Corticium candelabrum]|uniref:sideroflexin-1-like n=1 Tax=Corticium candelabrum TaxID=121492 RepID=UPI002E252227|nr:sideroflexin-1-like [Corticium candelabrum]XP_062522786.1 sideroflexin-1-like [Corticium candelabrum]
MSSLSATVTYYDHFHRPRIDLTKSRYDQKAFLGRARHFFLTTDPRNLVATSKQLDDAKQLLQQYKSGMEPSGTTDDDVWNAKRLYDSAFHPETGEKMFVMGRMSAQVPCNMTITGCMLTFYRSTPAILFWQWINQSFNAIVNYTNRSGDTGVSNRQLLSAYVAATGGAIAAALGVSYTAKKAPPIVARLGPFAAVAAANCINIPMMRRRELESGINVFDEDGNELGKSKIAARKAITQVVVSRVGMATPGMVLVPVVINFLARFRWYARYARFIEAPIQTLGVGFFLVFATPLCCALFPQQSSLPVSQLEQELQEHIAATSQSTTKVYFNKGL